MNVRLCSAVSAMVAAALPLAAFAQAPTYSTGEETIRGTISSVESVNHIFVSDDRGFTDDVTLRSGARTSSGGVRLEPGQRVTISGSNGGSTFLATRIATSGPSSDSDSSSAAVAYAVPTPAYYPAPVYYPAPYYYPAPFYSVSLGFGFGYGRYGYGGYRGGYYGGYRGGYYRGGYAGGYHGGGGVRVGVGVGVAGHGGHR